MDIKPIKKPLIKNPVLWMIIAIIAISIAIWYSYIFFISTPSWLPD